MREGGQKGQVPCRQGVSVDRQYCTLWGSGPDVGVAEDATRYKVGRRTVICAEVVHVEESGAGAGIKRT